MTKDNGNAPQLIDVVEEEPRMVRGPQQLLRVGLGLVSYGSDRFDELQERFEDLFGDLVERGETLEKDGRRMLEEMMDRRRQEAEDRREEAEDRLAKRMDSLLNRLNVPTRKDIQALNSELSALNRKVDALKKTTTS